ncbi:putative protein phosphatase 2C 39 [Apium graveolens]|uniref:putative protein phosphatase 2C 39 n=1 Tax=Apium graveolens TaxID=4045 RepID=UPI003D791C46
MEDPWLPPEVEAYIQTNHEALHGQKLCYLMYTGSNGWDHELIEDIFDRRDANIILSIPLNNKMQDDWYWRQEKMGYYLVKSAYLLMQEEKPDNGTNANSGTARDHEGKLVEARASCLRGSLKPELAKTIDIREDLSLVKKKNQGDVVIESDYLQMVQAICDVPRVDGELAVARELGDKSLKHLSSESEVSVEIIIEDTDYLILASDDIWKDLSNQEVVDCIKHVKCPQTAA